MNAIQRVCRERATDTPANPTRPTTGRSRVICAIGLLGLTTIGCGDRPEPASHASGDVTHFVVTSAASVIMPPQLAAAILDQCTRRVPNGITGYWHPDTAVIRRLEEDLSAVLARIARRSGRKSLETNEYYRQYAGIIANGRRRIYVNGFHRGYVRPYLLAQDTAAVRKVYKDTASWMKTPVNVCDGGSLYFGVEYDVAERNFGTVEFNERAG